jgi:plasmid stabilization system protein ParE
MNPQQEAASREGVSPEDIEVLSVQERQVSPTEKEVEIQYRVRRRGLNQLIQQQLEEHRIIHPAAHLEFIRELDRRLASPASLPAIGRFRHAIRESAAVTARSFRTDPLPDWYRNIRWSRPYPLNRLPWFRPLARPGVFVVTNGNQPPIAGVSLTFLSPSANLKQQVRTLGSNVRSNTPVADLKSEELRQLEQSEPGDDLFVRWTYFPAPNELAALLSLFWLTGKLE